MKALRIFLVSTMALASWSSCSKNDQQSSGSLPEVNANSENTSEISSDSTVTVINLKAGDDMKFDLSEIKVKEGQSIKLKLNNVGNMPKSAMGHNFVLLKRNIDVAKFANACVDAKAPDFDIPAELLKDVIAHTKMIGGGESTEIEFKAPPAGTYSFICSFPGHYMMIGILTVE